MVLELRDVCKDYFRGKSPVPVLRDVNLQVEKGEYIAIMGPSGSGKTTLMNLIGCLDLPTSGTYVLDGKEIGSLDDNRLAEIRNKYIGFVFQNFHLLPKMTALDNVALPLLYAGVSQKERRERAKNALIAVGLEDRLRFYPNQLSGGQCQRVAIARAMVTNPQLLLADEPTGALDTASGQQIMEIFRGLAEDGMTIIMITHEPAIAACAHKIYYIRDGQLQGNEQPKPMRDAEVSPDPEVTQDMDMPLDPERTAEPESRLEPEAAASMESLLAPEMPPETEAEPQEDVDAAFEALLAESAAQAQTPVEELPMWQPQEPLPEETPFDAFLAELDTVTEDGPEKGGRHEEG